MPDDDSSIAPPFGRSTRALRAWIIRLVQRTQLHIIVPAADGIWHYQRGRWSFRAVPGVGSKWTHIAADPQNPDHWWLTGEQPPAALETFDGGRTWQASETG